MGYSCSCLYAAALARAARTGLMSAEAIDAAKRAFDGVVNSLKWQGEDIQIGHVCIGTGVGNISSTVTVPASQMTCTVLVLSC